MNFLTRCYPEYNFLYGIEKIKDMIKMALEKGYHAINIVEKGSMHSLQEIVDLNQTTDIIVIFSVEILISIIGLQQPIILTPKSKTYLPKLNKLLKLDTIELSDLKDISEGFILTIIESKNLSKEQYTSISKQLKTIFSDIYLEYKVDLFVDNQDTINISRELNIPVIPGKTNILCSPYNSIHRDVLLCIDAKSKYHIYPKHNWEQEHISILHSNCFKYMSRVEGLHENVKSFLYKCNMRLKKQKVHINFKKDYTISRFRELVLDKLLKLISKKHDHDKFTYVIRAIQEYRSITELKYPNYFLILYDICNKAKEDLVYIGPGRGSAAGCLISYLLGITNIDPIKYGLYFERFLNKDRLEMPDIDMDINMTKRPSFIHSLTTIFGEDSVALVSAYATMNTRAALRYCGRVFGLSFFELNKLTSFISTIQNSNETLKSVYKFSKEFRKFVNSRGDYKRAVLSAMFLEGVKTGAGIHAGGVIIIPKDTFVPTIYTDSLGKNYKNFNAVIASLKNLENFGLVKIDLLGLRNCSVISETIDSLNIKLDFVPERDRDIFGDNFYNITSPGIFQMTQGIRAILRSTGCHSISSLSAATALFRPGPIGAGMVDQYIKNSNSDEKEFVSAFNHPKIKEILYETEGCLIYQEQISKIAIELAAFSGTQADILRKAIGKKESKEFEKITIKMKQGLIQHSKYTEETASDLIEAIGGFARYCFNKAHSYSYGMISYYNLHLKKNYPGHFISACINNTEEIDEKIDEYLGDAMHYDLEFVPPCYEKNKLSKCTCINGKLFLGFNVIKNLPVNVIESLQNTKDPYEIIQILPPKINRILIFIGFFDQLERQNNKQVDNIGHRVLVLKQFQLLTAEEKGMNTNAIYLHLLSMETKYLGLPLLCFSVIKKLKNELSLSQIYTSKLDEKSKKVVIKCMILKKTKFSRYSSSNDKMISYILYTFIDSKGTIKLRIPMENRFHEYKTRSADEFTVINLEVTINNKSFVTVDKITPIGNIITYL